MYYDEHGLTLRDRLTVIHLARPQNLQVHFQASSASCRKQNYSGNNEKAAGFDRRGYCRNMHHSLFTNGSKKENNPKTLREGYFFCDTYLNFHEPNVGISASSCSTCGCK